MTTTTDPVLDPLRRELYTQLLRYQVGREIFCPGATCGGTVLDARRAVGIGSTTVCTVCWAGLTGDQRDQLLQLAEDHKIELLDGPALHGADAVLVRS